MVRYFIELRIYTPNEFFSHNERDIYWNPSCVGGVKSGKRFTKIRECMRLNKNEPPSYRDRFFWLRPLFDGFNDNMKKAYNPS